MKLLSKWLSEERCEFAEESHEPRIARPDSVIRRVYDGDLWLTDDRVTRIDDEVAVDELELASDLCDLGIRCEK